MGIAGSLANTIVESAFHVVDTVNISSKAATGNKTPSTMSIVSKIWEKEGAFGFGRGFSACFYGAQASGFIYFLLYKAIKQELHEYWG
jgi:hypothetical protein